MSKNNKIGPGTQKGADYRPDTRSPLPGFYRARVEYSRDPLEIGRVKIRLPQLHGMLEDPDHAMSTSMLPWAVPGQFAAAANDMGEFIVPHVGTTVWIGFEEGDPNKPIYFGGIPSLGGDPKPMNHIGDIPKDKHPDSMSGHWYATTNGDAPEDMYEGRAGTKDVTRGVVFKSPKGHTVMYDDTDGKEELTIIDRSGQMIKMYSPVSVNDNRGNASRRKNRRADNNTQLDTSGYIRIQSKGNHVTVYPSKIEHTSSDKLGNTSKVIQTPTSLDFNAVTVKVNGRTI